ncbi:MULTISPECIES: 4'-phosphopantetheinyl transferase superfamily protein [Paraburkholderia]|uniref:4'-phosphopantetheinyl transferase family protein n=1 Tax=Paraburkholderia TaxID=1822464 RepID=UPI0022544434|nr:MULTISPECIES: hypothetical protein [Paraburkholderia]MCX4161494.1 hypothetical protein [Paraburkholderia megapolitana]MDN7156990.1 hypothetical protein [Paraburkholderia sp. CHISQ3]MDQ6494035.1 hypothetical protein [Paraburkholderia megapolitana]
MPRITFVSARTPHGNHVAQAAQGTNGRRETPRHAIYRVPDLAFLPQRLAWRRPEGDPLPPAGELLLWRVRPEWQVVSKEAAYMRLSKAELARVKNHPNPALGKRFAVGRAVLRGVLAQMLDCAPTDVALTDNPLGQPVLADIHRAGIEVQVAYAGVWIMIGISASPFGLGTRLPLPTDEIDIDTGNGTFTAALKERTTIAHSIALRSHVRHASLLAAAGKPLLDADANVLRQESAAFFVDTGEAGRWHVLDVPMPGAICAAVAAAQPVTRVHAFGWAGPDGRVDDR